MATNTEIAPREQARNNEACDGGSPLWLPRDVILHVPVNRLPDGRNY